MQEVIAELDADILVLMDVDYDLGTLALGALADYPHRFALRPNRGRHTGTDVDGDGRLNEPEDAVGYAAFSGQSGMGVLSRFPIADDDVRDLSQTRRGDIPGTLAKGVELEQWVSTTGHWDVPVRLPNGTLLHLLMWYATPPVFDGPEDRNGRRNHDEAALWSAYLDGVLGHAPPARFVLTGAANLDLEKSDGRPEALAALLSRREVQSVGPTEPTVHWPQTGELRVDYVLPSTTLRVIDSGVLSGRHLSDASRHRPVWIDIQIEGAGHGG